MYTRRSHPDYVVEHMFHRAFHPVRCILSSRAVGCAVVCVAVEMTTHCCSEYFARANASSCVLCCTLGDVGQRKIVILSTGTIISVPIGYYSCCGRVALPRVEKTMGVGRNRQCLDRY